MYIDDKVNQQVLTCLSRIVQLFSNSRDVRMVWGHEDDLYKQSRTMTLFHSANGINEWLKKKKKKEKNEDREKKMATIMSGRSLSLVVLVPYVVALIRYIICSWGYLISISIASNFI